MPDIPTHVAHAMGLILAILVIASVTVFLMKLKRPEKSVRELRLRIQSWWVIVLLLFAALAAGTTVTLVFLGMLSFLAFKEFISIFPTRRADRRVILFAYLAIPVQYLFVGQDWYGMFIIFIPVYLFLFLPVVMVLIGETRGFIRAAGTMHWAVMLTVFFVSHIGYLLMLPAKNPSAGSLGPIIYLIALTQFNDVAQFLWGKSLKGPKIIPRVSPNKTWAGFLGGVATTTVCAGLLAPYLTPMPFTHGLMAGLLVGIGGFTGDVVISSVKRDLNIKDSSQLIPGHGGVLDRIDSLMYTAPLFFHFLYYFYY